MNQDYQVEDLRERAEKILAMRTQEKKKLTYSEVYNIIYDLNLHQVELDLQNQSLRDAMIEIEQSRNKFADLYNFIPLGYFTLSESGLILEANQAGADLIGVNKNRLLNQVLLRYIAPSFQYIYVEHCKDALSTMTMQSCEVKFLSKNGGLFYVQIDTKPIISSMSGEKYLLTSVTDINERKLKEESVHQNQHQIATADRNMSLEKLGAVIAHELNQPLAITANYLHGCINRLESGVFQVDDIIGGLKKATEQYHRVAEIILRMKDFSCRGILHYEAFCINKLINQTMELIKYEALYFPVTIKYMLANNIPMVKIDRIHIQQVILNLVRNAVEALRDSDVSDASLHIETNHINEKMVEVCVTDNGPGVSSDVVYKLFHHNFTTKPYGIGLGLSISRSIIDAHGGVLSIEPGVTRGACFKFTLPIFNPT